MRLILSKGSHSTVFTDDAEPGIVIKEQKNPEEDPGYFKRQNHGYEIINQIKANYADTGVLLPELIGIEKLGDKQILKEKVIPGLPFMAEDNQPYIDYDTLSEQEKDSIAKQMATFLNAMHSSGECKPATESIKNIFAGELNNADKIIAKFEGVLPQPIANRLKKAENYILNSDISDEVVVLAHRDLRTQNLMYDAQHKQLAVIDFELADMHNVYRDFIARSPVTSMPWDFTKRVIGFYNKIPNKKYPITINPEKVQNMLLYGALHESARSFKPQEKESVTQEDNARLYKDLTKITGLNFDTRETFSKGISRVKQKAIIPHNELIGPDR